MTGRLICALVWSSCCVVGAFAVESARGQSAPPPTSSGAALEEFSIDPVHSVANFRVKHGAGMFWGRFDDVRGSIRHTGNAASPLELEVVVAINSIYSGNDDLNAHLKSEDFFHAEKYPEARFKSTSVRQIKDSIFEVTGDLTLRGVTKPITVTAEWFGVVETRRGRRCGLETTFTIKRSDYGISYGTSGGMLGDETRIIASLEGQDRGNEVSEAPSAGGLSPRLARFDSNGDGKLQMSEMPERMRARFEELDTNGDGAVDAKEAAAMRGRGRRGGGADDGQDGRGDTGQPGGDGK